MIYGLSPFPDCYLPPRQRSFPPLALLPEENITGQASLRCFAMVYRNACDVLVRDGQRYTKSNHRRDTCPTFLSETDNATPTPITGETPVLHSCPRRTTLHQIQSQARSLSYILVRDGQRYTNREEENRHRRKYSHPTWQTTVLLLSDRWQPAGILHFFRYIHRHCASRLLAFHVSR